MRAFTPLVISILLAAPAGAAELAIAPAGPCAIAPQRDPCAEGACTTRGAKVRGSFSPDSVADPGPTEALNGPTPPPMRFDGPGSCADPANGCGNPRVVDVVRFEAASPVVASGPPPAPPPTVIPNPPTPPPPPTRTPPSPPPVVVEPQPGPVLPPGANPVP